MVCSTYYIIVDVGHTTNNNYGLASAKAGIPMTTTCRRYLLKWALRVSSVPAFADDVYHTTHKFSCFHSGFAEQWKWSSVREQNGVDDLEKLKRRRLRQQQRFAIQDHFRRR